MKFVAVALVATAAAVSAAPCPLTDMLAYAKTPGVKACEAASGASLTTVAATGKFPDEKTMKIVCGNSDCQSSIGGLSKFAPCDLLSGAPLGGLLDEFKTKCAAIGGGSVPASTTAAPSATTNAPAPDATTAAPGAKAAAPSNSTTTEDAEDTDDTEDLVTSTDSSYVGSDSSDSGSSDDENAQAPVITKDKVVPTPAPTKKSSASMVATASGVVLVAVVASFV